MADLWHQFGGDLATDATGDLLLADGDTLVQQRILRRLLTNAGDYIWDVGYGAGVGSLIGKDTRVADIQNLVRTQIYLEDTVAKVPEATVTVSADQNGNVSCTISYTDAATGQTQTLNLPPS